MPNYQYLSKDDIFTEMSIAFQRLYIYRTIYIDPKIIYIQNY